MDFEALEQLFHKALNGDKRAYESFLTHILPYIKKRIAGRLVAADKIEDTAQMILISIHKAKHTYQPDRPLKPWIDAIIRYRLMDALRAVYSKREKEIDVESETMNFMAIDVTMTHDDYEYKNELDYALQVLGKKQRRIVEMAKIEGQKLDDVAEEMGMSLSAVKVTIHRAMKQMHTALIEKDK